jgi:hypothetical protein
MGCSDCNARNTADGPEDDAPGEGELLCERAEARGLPDAMTVEDRMWSVWRTATKRAESCAHLADLCTGTLDAESLHASNPGVASGVRDEVAREFPFDLDLAAKFEAAAAKWMDVSVKAGKLATVPVLHRERMAELERRARMVRGKGKAH